MTGLISTTRLVGPRRSPGKGSKHMRRSCGSTGSSTPLWRRISVSPSTVFLALDRVRSTRSGEAISLERSRLPWRTSFAEVLRRGLVEDSLQKTLENLDIRSIGGSEAVALARLTAEEASLLGRPEGDAFLATRRTVHGVDGRVVERVDSLLHPDHFKLQFNFGERPK